MWGGLPEKLSLQLLEPVREYYFKDEVREIGKILGIPDKVLMEHPFPGPGYAVRIRGEVTEKRLNQVKLADSILADELQKADIYHRLFQCFPVIANCIVPPLRVMGILPKLWPSGPMNRLIS